MSKAGRRSATLTRIFLVKPHDSIGRAEENHLLFIGNSFARVNTAWNALPMTG